MESTRYRERLIDEVKKYPVLYDTKHEQHRDIDVRDRCWLDISEKLGASCESLKREWKILRDSMRQAMKRSRAGARTKAGAPCKRWRFQARMAFVLPYITMRERRALRDRPEDPDEDLEPSPVTTTASWDHGHDALELFFASVCQASKRLPRPLQASLQRQVLDALLRAEEQVDADAADSKLPVKTYD